MPRCRQQLERQGQTTFFNAVNVAAFRLGLTDLGFAEGRNIEIDFAWGSQNEATMSHVVDAAAGRLQVMLLRPPARDRKELLATLVAIAGTRPDALLSAKA